MILLRNLSLGNKLALIIAVPSGVALLLACGALVLYDQSAYRRILARNLASQAEIIGNNSTGALLFDHEQTATEVLSALTANPHIVSARLYNAQGAVFAHYPSNLVHEPALAADARTNSVSFADGRVRVLHGIEADGQRVGMIELVSDLGELDARLEEYLKIAVVVLAIAFGVAGLLFSRMHRLVTAPIFELTRAADEIGSTRQYSLRAPKHGEDELGHLVDRFNAMLSEIQGRDTELSRARDQLEQRVAERTGELSQANTRLRQEIEERSKLEAQLRQAQKMEAVGQLAGGVAHDFNNILTVILGHASLLSSCEHLPRDMAEPIQEIESSAKRAANLTRQLLTFSRRQVPRMTPLNLNEALANVAKMLQRLLGEHFSLDFHHASDLPFIEADVHMMEQVVVNLAVNARDAMPQGGSVTISTAVSDFSEADVAANAERRVGRYVCLQVQDTGCGMDPATLNRMFEPFFTTKPVGKGTGLGLATVYGIVNQHGGWVEVASAVNQGTTFRVYFAARPRPQHTPETTRVRPAVKGGTETILVVEDEDPVRQFVCLCLRKHGYRILEARDGKHALDLWDDHRDEVDLVLTDLVMPEGINGRELAERFRQDRPELKIIYSSGYSEDVVKGNLNVQEEFDYLPKPYDPAKLAHMVRDRLDHK